MSEWEMFEFMDYLDKMTLLKVEQVFSSQCLVEEFKGFRSSLGSNGKAYLSYLCAHAMMEGVIAHDSKGFTNFLNICNGYGEQFFQDTVHHFYNLCHLRQKDELFTSFMEHSEQTLKTLPKKPTEFSQMQLKDYVKNMLGEVEANHQHFLLKDYQTYYQQYCAKVMKDKLHESLPQDNPRKPAPKI